MGLTKSAEIAEQIEEHKKRIEESLSFLSKFLDETDHAILTIRKGEDGIKIDHIEIKIRMIN
jgi:hypothetical protein